VDLGAGRYLTHKSPHRYRDQVIAMNEPAFFGFPSSKKLALFAVGCVWDALQ